MENEITHEVVPISYLCPRIRLPIPKSNASVVVPGDNIIAKLHTVTVGIFAGEPSDRNKSGRLVPRSPNEMKDLFMMSGKVGDLVSAEWHVPCNVAYNSSSCRS
jgi:hypothetical protein